MYAHQNTTNTQNIVLDCHFQVLSCVFLESGEVTLVQLEAAKLEKAITMNGYDDSALSAPPPRLELALELVHLHSLFPFLNIPSRLYCYDLP